MGQEKLFSRLFFFGDKAKHFVLEAAAIESSRWLRSIDDCNPSTARVIFEKIANLPKSKNPHVRTFCETNGEFFAFFGLKANRQKFEKALVEAEVAGVTCFSGLLHVVGSIGVGDKSISLSTSLSYPVARKFAGKAGAGVVVGVVRSRDLSRNRLYVSRILEKYGIPAIPASARVFPMQREFTLRAGLLPHNLLCVYDARGRRVILNPHLFSHENSGTNIAMGPILIDQSNFEERLQVETAFTGWFADDGPGIFHGGRIR
jgi:hypothetical protein